MGLVRSMLLAGSQSAWLREHAPRYRFVRRTAARFMPGETADEALAAARSLQRQRISTVFTLLGENVTERGEAEGVRDHYLKVLGRVRELGLPAGVSIKLTQLGLDLGPDLCYRNLEAIVSAAEANSAAAGGAKEHAIVWIDMEASDYTDLTLELYRRALVAHPNVGICLQSYLYRTETDLASLIPLGASIRLVKGAYKEPADRAFPHKKDVDENFYKLARQMIEARRAGVYAAFGTHDCTLIRRIQQFAESSGVAKDAMEFQMLYGIQRNEQLRLAQEGWRSRVLVAYGSYWFAWFMRRLAERPANVLFIVKHLLRP